MASGGGSSDENEALADARKRWIREEKREEDKKRMEKILEEEIREMERKIEEESQRLQFQRELESRRNEIRRAAEKRLEEMRRLEGAPNRNGGPCGGSISSPLPETSVKVGPSGHGVGPSGHGVGPSGWRTRPCGQLEEIRCGQNIPIVADSGRSGHGPAGMELDVQPRPGGPRPAIGESLPQPHGGCSLSRRPWAHWR